MRGKPHSTHDASRPHSSLGSFLKKAVFNPKKSGPEDHHVKNARTTPAIRQELRELTLSQKKLAEQYNLHCHTVAKWRKREEVTDRSHRPHTLHTTLTPVQEAIAVALRETLLLCLDDLLVVVREFLNPYVSRSRLDRCLRQHGVSRLASLKPQEDKQKQPAKSFRGYEPGFAHIDVKYLPQIPDEEQRRYLFTAIDRATRWV